jgi:hypothetical protein
VILRRMSVEPRVHSAAAEGGRELAGALANAALPGAKAQTG